MATTSSRFGQNYLQPLIAVILIVAVLYVAKSVILPLALAVLLTFILTPVVRFIQQGGIKRIPAVLLTALLTFALFGLVGFIVGVQIKNLAQELPTHRDEIDEKIASLKGNGEGPFQKLMQMVREIGKGEPESTATWHGITINHKVVAQLPDSSSFEQLVSAATPIVEPLAQTGLVVVLVIFMLIKREDLRNRIIGLLGHGQLTGTTRVLVDSAQRLSRFLFTQLLINLGFGVLFALGLFLAGVPYAILWGFLAVTLRFVPYIGALVAVSFPLVLSFAVAPSLTQPITVVAIFAVLELITGNVVEPLLFGHGTGVTPIALLIAAAFWTWIWGPIGLVLSTPLTVCMVVLGQNVPRLRFFALLLGDQPALEPFVSYYQRLLAHDEQEAKQVTVDHAREHGQENVFDKVLLPALALTCRDRKHGGLSAEEEAYIFQSTEDIMKAVADPELVAKPTKADDGSAAETKVEAENQLEGVLILGCPAHHVAEELTLSMLGQLLSADGCRVDMVGTKELPADIENRIRNEHPALVFVSIMPPGGFVQARYLCKRLREQFPKLPIVVGYWGAERHYDKVLVRLRSAGASYVTTSLAQSRSQIRALASRVDLSPSDRGSRKGRETDVYEGQGAPA